MNDIKQRAGATDILLMLLNIVFFIGMETVLEPCDVHAEGMPMPCHWAGNALSGISAVLVIICVMHLAARPQVKVGLSLAIIPLAALAIVLPGHLIDLCMMESMRCHTVMQPAVMVISVLNIVLAAADIHVQRREE